MANSENSNDSLQLSFEQAIAIGDVEWVRNLVNQSSDSWSDYSSRYQYNNTAGKVDANALFIASLKSGNVEIMDEVLQLRPPPSVRYMDQNGRRLLHFAAETSFLEIVRRLLSMGSLVNVTDNDGVTPVMIAASKGYADIVELLVQQGGRLNRARHRRTGESSLHQAAEGGHLEVVKVLVTHRADVNCLTPFEKGGMSVLHKAVLSENPEVVKFLCQNGACLTKPDASGRPSFHLAAHKGFVNILEAFLEIGADFEMKDDKQRTVLCAAVLGQAAEAVAFLLDRGANVNTEDDSGYQPLHHAAAADKVDIVNLLLNYGANANHETKNLSTPLMEACLAGSPTVVETLLAYGADVTKADRNKRTALHKAQICAKDMQVKEELSLQLIAAGAPISVQDNNRYTPLHNLVFQCVVNSKEHLDAIKIFVRYGAGLVPEASQPRGQVDIFAPGFTLQSFSDHRNSPLCWLTWNGFYEAARFLVLAGWELKGENWLDLPGKSPEHSEFMAWLRTQTQEAKPLMSLCREAIRKYLMGLTQGREILSKIAEVPVPPRIISYLNLDDL